MQCVDDYSVCWVQIKHKTLMKLAVGGLGGRAGQERLEMKPLE